MVRHFPRGKGCTPRQPLLWALSHGATVHKKVKQQAKPCQKRYEIFWERDISLPEVIKEAWESVGSVDNLEKLQTGLSKTLATLSVWGNKKFGNISWELAKSRTQLEELMSMNADRQDIRNITDKMNELIYQEEMMWLQRSTIMWLKEGDRNTKYF